MLAPVSFCASVNLTALCEWSGCGEKRGGGQISGSLCRNLSRKWERPPVNTRPPPPKVPNVAADRGWRQTSGASPFWAELCFNIAWPYTGQISYFGLNRGKSVVSPIHTLRNLHCQLLYSASHICLNTVATAKR